MCLCSSSDVLQVMELADVQMEVIVITPTPRCAEPPWLQETVCEEICDLVIVKLHQSSLIIILMYRPPTCPITEFNDIILKTKSYIMSLPSPLPNIIMLGDFNFHNIDWSRSTTSCPMAGPLIDLAGLLFLTQQVKVPTRKLNV